MHAIRPLTASDLVDGMRLKDEAGWNQIEADWRRFLALGADGCFVAERERRVVGSATTCLFDSVGWVAMVLVEKACRGAGIGRSLLLHCLDHLESAGAKSVRLDATSLGRPLYESLGFRVDFHLHRHQGVVIPCARATDTRETREADLDALAEIDRRVTGTNRRPLLDRLFQDQPRQSLVNDSTATPNGGFVFWRPGSSANQIGPCVAELDLGEALLSEAGRRLEGREVIVDIPSDHKAAAAWADGAGLTRRREFWRMTRGESVVEDLGRLWASSGPEMG